MTIRSVNQYTIEEANRVAVSGEFDGSETLYRSGDDWGETVVGTMEQWENEIPEDEEAAKSTGFYDWFRDLDTDEDWADYRDGLLEQLVEIELVQDVEAAVEKFIEQARAGEAPQISSGVYLMTGADLNASRDEDEVADDLIDDQLYIHTNDGVIEAVDNDDIAEIIKK